MSVYTGTNPATLKRLTDDVRQLTHPIHIAVRGRVITHDPLLDQLRGATIPGSSGTRGPERRTVPGPRTPASLDAVDVLSTLYVEISNWRVILRITSPDRALDWQKAVLNRFADAAPTIASSLAEELGHAVHGWWSLAATAARWRTADLLKLR